eukprot:3376628-Amphidinium_carterae.1
MTPLYAPPHRGSAPRKVIKHTKSPSCSATGGRQSGPTKDCRTCSLGWCKEATMRGASGVPHWTSGPHCLVSTNTPTSVRRQLLWDGWSGTRWCSG